MLKKFMAGAAALLVLGMANAAPKYYSFEWKGFNSYSTNPWTGETSGGWNPLSTIKGYFKGEDLDGDNVIRQDEIERFGLYYGSTYRPDELIGCPDTGPGVGGLTSCSLSGFSYVKGGALAFTASGEWSSGGDVYSYVSWSMPNGGFSRSSNDVCCGSSWKDPTPETRFTITAAVPEPTTWAMLAAGLLVSGAVARRRATRS
ncbi:PEP-CTERM sorting domain-containing protein [Massilia sp. YMA4]|uniref:PEP-CTERM sorting domain-containing protein n=1 Tax=Massilia sp. YMA4 TaxID=1593482 RepID=UPI001D0C4C16|nr:PEP-CTERM sorting domain-containing protein [Massilia sp. YMA4]